MHKLEQVKAASPVPHLLMHSLAHSLTHSPTHSLTHPLTHSLMHPAISIVMHRLESVSPAVVYPDPLAQGMLVWPCSVFQTLHL